MIETYKYTGKDEFAIQANEVSSFYAKQIEYTDGTIKWDIRINYKNKTQEGGILTLKAYKTLRTLAKDAGLVILEVSDENKKTPNEQRD